MARVLPLTKPPYQMLWYARSTNVKTGNVPGGIVGTTREQVWNSCDGCGLRGVSCYAWQGTVGSFALKKVFGGHARNPNGYTIEKALKARRNTARMVRVGVIGDPARAEPAALAHALKCIRAADLAVIGYTHFPTEAPWLKEHLMVSCDTVEDADVALAEGWRPTVVLSWDHLTANGPRFWTLDGAPGIVCPAQSKERVTCNDCRLCDPQHPMWASGKVLLVGFVDHCRRAKAEAKRMQRSLWSVLSGQQGGSSE